MKYPGWQLFRYSGFQKLDLTAPLLFAVIGSSRLFQSASNAVPFMGMDRYKSAFAAVVCGGASLERG
jgi:hypothetical protein